MSTATEKTTPIESSSKKVLLLGDGDFTFTLALYNKISKRRSDLPLLASWWASEDEVSVEITPTCFDTKEEVLSKYSNFETTCKQLSKVKSKRVKLAEIQYGVDATTIHETHKNEKWDLIIFNNPHLGVENKKRNGGLCMHILYSSLQCTEKSGGQIWITLVKEQLEQWQILQTASNTSMLKTDLRYLGSFSFLDTFWPGYTCRRHQSGKSFRNVAFESLTHVFVHFKNRMSTTFAQQVLQQTQQKILQSQTPKKESTVLKCHCCDQTFTEQRSLDTHFKHKHGAVATDQKTNESFSCSLCKATFHNHDAMTKHYISVHSGQHLNVKPDWKENDFFAQRNIIQHSSDSSSTHYFCELCDALFSDQEEHKQYLSPTPITSRVICDVCGQEFVATRDLLQHKNFKHST
ncbi:hypothetical protein RFI_13262 [Reticulomyxa filosa]|uniref:C2H2-type domain-containing protein n=1 Tax=Reticulomyxa filosa TaxID=46433 RepID=X6NEZ7_RETFI|nr:hypothetical protein RFI_13262 [Reticulomyxa filosa]|eukprot:ETO23897.1 hypothetical protein RFI_13262 [Reticulomyxa filosa]